MKLLAVIVSVHWIEKLSKSKKFPAVKYVLIFLKLTLTDI